MQRVKFEMIFSLTDIRLPVSLVFPMGLRFGLYMNHFYEKKWGEWVTRYHLMSESFGA